MKHVCGVNKTCQVWLWNSDIVLHFVESPVILNL